MSTCYKVSAPEAEFIVNHPALRPMLRVGPLPAVAVTTLAVSTELGVNVQVAVSLAVIASGLVVLARKRKAHFE